MLAVYDAGYLSPTILCNLYAEENFILNKQGEEQNAHVVSFGWYLS
jgi:hypothetical protein